MVGDVVVLFRGTRRVDLGKSSGLDVGVYLFVRTFRGFWWRDSGKAGRDGLLVFFYY